MEMNVRDDKQLVEIWLTNAEKKDLALREGLKDIYDKYKKKKYLVAVFESGEKDLYQGTLDLLAYIILIIPCFPIGKSENSSFVHS